MYLTQVKNKAFEIQQLFHTGCEDFTTAHELTFAKDQPLTWFLIKSGWNKLSHRHCLSRRCDTSECQIAFQVLIQCILSRLAINWSLIYIKHNNFQYAHTNEVLSSLGFHRQYTVLYSESKSCSDVTGQHCLMKHRETNMTFKTLKRQISHTLCSLTSEMFLFFLVFGENMT